MLMVTQNTKYMAEKKMGMLQNRCMTTRSMSSVMERRAAFLRTTSLVTP